MHICNADGVSDVNQICLPTLYLLVPEDVHSLFIAHVDKINESIVRENRLHLSLVGKSFDGAEKATLGLTASRRRVSEGA